MQLGTFHDLFHFQPPGRQLFNWKVVKSAPTLKPPRAKAMSLTLTPGVVAHPPYRGILPTGGGGRPWPWAEACSVLLLLAPSARGVLVDYYFPGGPQGQGLGPPSPPYPDTRPRRGPPGLVPLAPLWLLITIPGSRWLQITVC